MSAQIFVIAALLLAAVAGCLDAWRARGWRRALGLAANLAFAALLYPLFFPPVQEAQPQTLHVLAANTPPDQQAALPDDARVVALPGADAGTWPRVPDLATALRRYPDTGRLRVYGDGLGAADRDAARGWPLDFTPGAVPQGIAALQLPAEVRAGHRFAIEGEVNGPHGQALALREPGGQISRTTTDAHGHFRFELLARRAGDLQAELQLPAADGSEAQTLSVPVAVRPGARLRLLLLAGGPDPDLKYLQRWALDAGHEVSTRISLSRGITQQRGDAGLDDAALAQTDVLVIDERAWAQLDKAGRARLLQAVEQGLGLLLRLGGPLPAAVAADWRALGISLQNADIDTKATIPGETGEGPAAALRRLPLQPASALASLADAADGKALGVWRNRGLGRAGALWLQGSHSLVLSGQAPLHDAFWAQVLDRLARPRQAAAAAITDTAWRGERLRLCHSDSALSVTAPDGTQTTLIPRRDEAGRWCAGFWPRLAGWHEWRAGELRTRFYVRDPQTAIALHRSQTRAATRALAGEGEAGRVVAAQAGPRWPWFLAWLLPAGLCWWLQRRRTRGQDS
jgi:hypothetical protein